MKHAATFSRCQRYRYQLERCWGEHPSRNSTVVFIGLNPSTADAKNDDPTLRKCVAFARGWGFKRLVMVNLFAWRATDPENLLQTNHPIGKQNDKHIDAAVAESALIIACWGEYGAYLNRAQEVHARYSQRLHCLQTNKSGEPTHPLYLPATLTPVKLKKARPALK